MTIIPQIIKMIKTNEEVMTKVLLEDGGRHCNHLNMISYIKEILDEAGRGFVAEIMSDMEELLFQSKQRKQNYRVHRKADKRVISTKLGDIEYERRYYQDKRTGSYHYLLDEEFEIEKSSRMDMDIIANMLSLSSQMSYQKTIDMFDNIGIHSKTTVMNVQRKYGDIAPETAPIGDKKEKKILYIEADEDHVAYQNGKNQQMKLVYVHEGIEKVSKHRNQLKNVRYYAGMYKGCSDELWDTVYQDIVRRYDEDKIETIYLSGDGANWIKQGLEVLPGKTTFVLDKFHTRQAVKRACVGVQEVYQDILKWITEGNQQEVEAFFEARLSDETITKSQKQQIEKAKTYLFNHWEAIQRQKLEDYMQCSAEGHVSHVLSSRLSSRPRGWGEENADHIAKIRAYELNGGSVLDHLVEKSNQQRKQQKVERLNQRVIKNKYKKDNSRHGHLAALTHSKKSYIRKYWRLMSQ